MVHGDDKGLVLPPRIAQVQVVIIPIPNKKLSEEEVARMDAKVEETAAALRAAGVKVATDCRTNYTPGWKYNHWELKGVPLRMELGPRDMDAETFFVARRDTGEKQSMKWADVVEGEQSVPALLERIQREMLERAKEEFDSCIEKTMNWEEFEAALDRGHMCLAPWADEVEIEEAVKKASAKPEQGLGGCKSLCMPMVQPELPAGTKCFWSGKPAKNWCLFGRSY